MATYNYLNDLVNSASGFDKFHNNFNIGGIDFGKNWNDGDSAMLNLMAASAQAQMQLDMIDDERNYNLPVNQVKRMREAGLNPDLQQIDNGNTSASYSSQSIGASGAPQPNFVRDVLPQLPSLLNSAIGIYSQIQGVQQSNNVIKSQKLSNLGLEQGLMKGSYFTYLDDLGKYYDASEQFRLGKISEDEFSQIGLPDIRNYAGLSVPHSYSKRDKKAFERSFYQYVGMNESNLRKAYDDFRLGRKKTEFENAKYEGFEEQIDDTLSIVLGGYFDNELKAADKRNTESFKREELQTDIMKNQKSLTDDAVKDSQSKGVERDFMSDLYKDYKSGNTFSGILLVLINSMKSATSSMENIF